MDTHLDNALVFSTTAEGFNDGDFFVSSMHAREGLSSLYEVSLELTCSIDGGVSPDGIDLLLDASAQVGFGPGGMHHFSGVLRDIELMDMEQDGMSSVYRATLVPRLWLATLVRRSRVFNEMAFPDIVRQVLGDLGMTEDTDFELRLRETYPVREYVAQYEESDFDFLSRWMERLGIYYCFAHEPDRDRLVLTDASAELLTVIDNGECVYSQHEELASGGVHRMRRRTRRVPEEVHVREFNWRTPARPVVGEFPVDPKGRGKQVFYGDHFKDDAEGETVARLRAEEWQARKHRYAAQTVNPDFSPGFRFTVSGAPVGELDGEYLLTAVSHSAAQESGAPGSGGYSNEFEAISFAAPFRPPRVTPWPRIDGVMHAKIDAESVSSAAPIDDQGRYRVVMPFDLYGQYGGKATRWIRKAEPYSGPAYGMHFTLHVGAEVLLAHVGGDPDRPVIVGSVPNPSTGSPMTSANPTRSAIRTRSGILFDFEDDA